LGRAITIRHGSLGRWTIVAQELPATQTTAAGESLKAARGFAVEVARLLANTRCHQVVVLDVAGVSPITDFLVLATGTSPRQMKSVSDESQEFGESRGFRALSQAGDTSGNWIAIDFFNVVVHVFSQDARDFYDLDNLWGDAKQVEWREPEAVAAE
jgi:ribosome-associated protein